MSFVNYDQVLTDLVTLLTANVTGLQKVGKNLDERDFTFAQMPLVDVRMKQAVPDLTGGQSYYVDVIIEFEVACHDLSSRDEAAILRDGIVNQVQDTIRLNPRFGASNDSVELGPVDFATEEDVKTGAFVSAAVGKVIVKVYT